VVGGLVGELRRAEAAGTLRENGRAQLAGLTEHRQDATMP
jgi:hypothetical protein